MKKLLTFFQAFCVATVITELALLGIVMSRGLVNKEKLDRAMAVVYEFDDILLDDKGLPKPPPPPSLEEVARQRAQQGLDIHLQEEAITAGMAQVQYVKQQFETDVSRFKNVKKTFYNELNRKIKEAKEEALLSVQKAWEVLPAKSSKRQIILALGDDRVEQVARILQQMTIARSRKILSEFKTPEEAAHRLAILRQMRKNPITAGEQ